MTEEAKEIDVDHTFIEYIMDEYCDLFMSLLKAKKFMRDDDTFTNDEMAYVMWHMFEAFEQFDEHMETFYNNGSIVTMDTDGMTPQ